MPIQDPIPLILRGKKILEKDLEKLWQHLALLEDAREAKQLSRFIESDPAIKDSGELVTLLKKLYRKFSTATENKFYRANDLFSQLGLEGTEGGMVAKTGRLLRNLVEAIREFRVRQSLRERPALRAMILAESIKLEGNHAVYEDVLVEWEKALNKLPLGTWRLYQRWRYEDACHFNLGNKKHKAKHSHFSAALAAFENFRRLYEEFYGVELLNRGEIMQDVSQENAPPAIEEEKVLADLYAKVREVLQEKSFNPAGFDSYLKLFADTQAQLDPYHRMALFSFSGAALAKAKRKKAEGVDERRKSLLQLLVTENFLEGSPGMTTPTYLNRLAEASFLGDIDLMRRLRDKLLPLLPEQEILSATFLTELRIHFDLDQHHKVINILEDELPTIPISGYHEHLNLKAIQLRSALVLHYSGEDPDGLFQRTADTYYKLISNNEEDFNPQRREEAIRFLRFCEKLYRVDAVALTNVKYLSLREEVEHAPLLGYRDWLRCFVAHLDPDLRPKPTALLPSLNRDKAWVNSYIHPP